MREQNFDRYANTVDSRVPIQGKYARDIRELGKAAFRYSMRSVKLNRQAWRFDVHVVDADPEAIKQFVHDFPMCYVENTFSQVALEAKTKSRKKAAV